MNRIIEGYALICTCEMCPEQYDVYSPSGKKVGYLRLRHGYFTAEYPDCGGGAVYASEPMGDGCFANEEEAVRELTAAVQAIHRVYDADNRQFLESHP